MDADCDGYPDIVVANGHVADFGREDAENYMPTQFFRQLENFQFSLLSADEAGEFFGRKIMGRSVARLDWNQDGLPDFVCGTIGSASQLLTNVTGDAGRFLSLRLHAVNSARDAIGTVVTVSAGGRQQRAQLTTGDGYQASNEKILHFGLGTVDSIDRFQIEWPGPEGITQILINVPPDRMLELTKGHPRATVWVQGEPASFAVERHNP